MACPPSRLGSFENRFLAKHPKKYFCLYEPSLEAKEDNESSKTFIYIGEDLL